MRTSRNLIAAAAVGSVLSLASSAASAGCCGETVAPIWSGAGCCAAAPVLPPILPFGCCNRPVAQPVYVQQPQVVTVQPAPVVVQVAQPQVVVQQAEPVVQSYQVNQGPVYSGPGADYSPAVYEQPAAVTGYPYVAPYGGGLGYGPYYRHGSYYRYGVRPRPYVGAWRYPARYGVRYPVRRAYVHNRRWH